MVAGQPRAVRMRRTAAAVEGDRGRTAGSHQPKERSFRRRRDPRDRPGQQSHSRTETAATTKTTGQKSRRHRGLDHGTRLRRSRRVGLLLREHGVQEIEATGGGEMRATEDPTRKCRGTGGDAPSGRRGSGLADRVHASRRTRRDDGLHEQPLEESGYDNTDEPQWHSLLLSAATSHPLPRIYQTKK